MGPSTVPGYSQPYTTHVFYIFAFLSLSLPLSLFFSFLLFSLFPPPSFLHSSFAGLSTFNERNGVSNELCVAEKCLLEG
jgi:hypothetical protein